MNIQQHLRDRDNELATHDQPCAEVEPEEIAQYELVRPQPRPIPHVSTQCWRWGAWRWNGLTPPEGLRDEDRKMVFTQLAGTQRALWFWETVGEE